MFILLVFMQELTAYILDLTAINSDIALQEPCSKGQWEITRAHSYTANYEGPFPSEGHREVPCAAILWRSCGEGRCPPASPSLPRTRVVGRKVGRGKELCPPLDSEERESIDSNPGSVR